MKPEKHPLARILVVEDDKSISDMLKNILSEEGYHVTQAYDANSALDKLGKYSFDLVLLDLHFPDQTGFNILKEIRKRDQEYEKFMPVIVLTGVYTSRKDKVNSLDAGADDFLAKPFDLIELLSRVRSLLRIQELYKRSQFLATHDPLTRCYNRRYLLDFLNREFERFKRYKEPLSFLMMDLDHFKAVNDKEGHDVGDALLMQIGFKFQDFFRAVDCVARLGGDEFAAALPSCAAAEASKVADRLLAFIGKMTETNGIPKSILKMVGISIGVATLPTHASTTEELMRLADQALYAAKDAGRNQFRMAA